MNPNFLRKRQEQREFLFVSGLLILLNLPGLSGRACQALALVPSQVWAGEWWRVVTHPLVHVSWYHFLLDGSAFLSLYHALSGHTWRRRAGYLTLAFAGSVVGATFQSTDIAQLGLCGLSGVAHGLMAIAALNMIKDEPYIGTGLFLGVLGKSVLEVASGQPLFAFLHFGLLGTPMVCTHAGGMLGGTLGWFLFFRRNRK